MHDARRVGGRQRIGHLPRVAQRLVERKGAACEPCCQRLAFEILHHEVVEAVVASDVEHRADVAVAQRGDGACLALEPGASFGCRIDAEQAGLHGDVAVEPRVVCLVHLTHAASAERRQDFVRAEARAWDKGHRAELWHQPLSARLWNQELTRLD